MVPNQSDSKLSRQISSAIGGAILLASIVLAIHPWILTFIGFAGGFQFLVHTGPIYFGVGIGIILVTTAGHSIQSRSTLVVLAVTLCTTALLILVGPIPLPSIEQYLLYVPAMTAFPIGVAIGDRHNHLLIALVSGSALSLIVEYVLVLSGSPQGPIGMFLFWFTMVVLVFSIPLLAVGWYFGQNTQ